MTPLLSSGLLATQSDARLLALAAAGHDRAFEAIVERYRRPLGRYLRRVLSGPLAEDVLQATFVNAWTSLRRGTEVRDLRPWLYRIAHNQAVNALSRAEPRLAVEHDADRLAATVAGPEAEVERRDTLKRALTAIAGLPDRQRAALVAVAVEDRSHPDVARELGLTEG
ncbi:MAG: sigma-70 family RNA polymerase sigma factor, partial [Actinomycetota bacterium]|nr:sigma-70 family RNA polymerase sigma factor [Actinomycetota bacterium]